MKPWGYAATLGWAILAFVIAQFAALGVLLWWRAGDLNSLLETPFDGVLVTLFILIANPVGIAVLLLAVRLARADPVEYLALRWPPTREVIAGIGWLAVLIAATDLLLYLAGKPLVSQFQEQSYLTIATPGWLFAMLIGAIMFAPAGEEVMFRGFLFRGWVRPERSPWPAIVVISVLWAALHVQYDWTGLTQIFVAGLYLGWMRWRSGSTLLTFFLHALFNLEGTMETVLKVHFFP